MLPSFSTTMHSLTMTVSPAVAEPILPRLQRKIATLRRSRIDRRVADDLKLLNHPGIAEDYRIARCGR